METQGFRLKGAIKTRGNQGIDLEFTGIGNNAGRIALAEAKRSPSLGALKRDTKGIRQGSIDFFQTRAEQARRFDVVDAINDDLVDYFAGFSRSGRLFRLNFRRDVDFRTDANAAKLVK